MKKNSVSIVLVSLLLSSLGTTAVLAKEKIEKHNYDVSIESGFGYDSNPFATPSSSYNDLTKTSINTGDTLVKPDVKSGTFIPINFNANYEYRYKKDIRFLVDAKYSGKFFMDSALDNADEYKTDLSTAVRFRFNKYKREINRIDLEVYVGNVHEIYVDHDDGTSKITSGGDQSKRYQYKKSGIELKYKYDFKKIDFLVRGIFEIRDYETPETWSSLDHAYTRLKIKAGYQFDKKLYAGSYYEYKLRNYDERKSYEIDAAGDISLVLPGVNYSYNDISFFAKYKVNKSYKIDLSYLMSSRSDDNQGYANYVYHKLSWINNYKFNKKLQSSLKLTYNIYDYENAYAYDNNTTLDKKESHGYRLYLDTKYKFSSKWIGSLNINYREEKSTDKRYEYEELITMLNMKYRF